MNMNEDLKRKLDDFPEELSGLAKYLLQELDKGRHSSSQIEKMIRDEIREIVIEEIEDETN